MPDWKSDYLAWEENHGWVWEDNFRQALNAIKANSTSFHSLRIVGRSERLRRVTCDVKPGSADDWKGLGLAIGRNDQISLLSFGWNDNPGEVSVENLEAFCRGLQQNKSINRFTFCPSQLVQGEVLSLITSCFHKNENLKNITVKCNVGALEPEKLGLFCMALQSWSFVKSIQIVGISSRGDGHWADFITSLGQMSQLEELRFMRSCLGYRVTAALAGVLQNPQSRLTCLSISFCCSHTDETADNVPMSLFRALQKNKTLKMLRFHDRKLLTPLEWNACTSSLQFNNHTLEVFSSGSFLHDPPPEEVRTLLEMNRQENKKLVRMRKILLYGFPRSGQQLALGLFDDNFDAELLPSVLSSIGRKRSRKDCRSEQCRFSTLYILVRHVPLLVVNSRSG